MFYYQLHNVGRDTEEAISDFLNHENETVSGEIPNYYQESSSDEEDRTDDFVYSKNKVMLLKKRFWIVKILLKILCFMQFVML